MTCKYCKGEFCTNVESPACADYCPCQNYDYVELCKFAKGINYCEKCIHYDLCLYNAYQIAYSKNSKNCPVKVEIKSDTCANFRDKSMCIVPPCKINSHIFVIPTEENGLEKITKMRVVGFKTTETYSVVNCYKSKELSQQYNVPFFDFGKTAFLTYKKAEQALKERDLQ